MSTQTPALPRLVRFTPSTGPLLHAERYDGGLPAFLLIHGWGDGAFVWDLFAPTLARRFTTIAVDLRGHGGSGWDPTGHYDIDGYVSDVVHVMEQSGLRQFILVGHSLGGRIATHLCARYPERVLASVLVDFAPQLDPAGMRQAARLLRESLQLYESEDRYADWLKETRPLAQPALLEHVAACALRKSVDGFRLKLDPALAEAFRDFEPQESQFLWNQLQQQACPTLIVRGGGSAVLPRATANRVVELLPRGELAVVNGAGHSVMLDNPIEFERVVLAFLAKMPTMRPRAPR